MSSKSSGRLKIPQWAIVSRTVTAFDIATDEYDVETGRTRTDLTGAVVHFTVRDAAGVIVIQKTSADPLEILILDQTDAATKGQSKIFFLEDDTGALLVDGEYWFDCWAANGTSEEPIVDRGRFFVCESVTHISVGVAPSIPTYPSPQLSQERSFKWTAPSDGDDFTITIPGTGMVDGTYCVTAEYSFIPDPVVWASRYFPEASRTATQFQLLTSSNILTGTVVDFILRDS